MATLLRPVCHPAGGLSSIRLADPGGAVQDGGSVEIIEDGVEIASGWGPSG